MDLHCGGEDPALQEVRSKEAKAISSMDNGSNAYYDDHFFMEIGSAPSAATVVTAGTAAKVGELLFYAEQAVVTVQIAYTVTYVLSDDVVVEAEIFVDSTSVYKVQDTQDAGANTLSVVTGYDFNGDGSHSVEVYLNVIGA